MKKDDQLYDLDFSYLTSEKPLEPPKNVRPTINDLPFTANAEVAPAKPKRRRRKKDEEEPEANLPVKETELNRGQEVASNTFNALAREDGIINYATTDIPYGTAYKDTNQMLTNSILQLDVLINDNKVELDKVRASNARNKYKSITDLGSSTAAMISTKINAIKELNATITHSQELDMKRRKDQVAAQVENKETNEQKIANLYQAYLNMPSGANPYPNFNSPNVFAPQDMRYNTINIQPEGVIPETPDYDPSYDEYQKNKTDVQRRMEIGANPDLETVALYDRNTGDIRFGVVNNTTGKLIPDAPVPEEDIRQGLVPDLASGIAKNPDFNLRYQLKVVNPNNEVEDVSKF